MAELVPHDGTCVTFVCRRCVVQITPPDDGGDVACPQCGRKDTRWMFAEHASEMTEAEMIARAERYTSIGGANADL